MLKIVMPMIVVSLNDVRAYNLIVDGTVVRTDSEKWKVQFESAILHRPVKSSVPRTDDGCDSDCKPV